MDNVTHSFLGMLVGQGLQRDQARRTLIWTGMLAANAPDIDIFFRVGNPLNAMLIHRTFTHALLAIPIGAAAVWGFMMLFKAARAMPLKVFLIALAAITTHGLLDACTTYGTELLWPLSHARIAWDCMAIVDPFFTLLLGVMIVIAARLHSAWPARLGLLLALAYIGAGVLQHARAMDAQQAIASARHQVIERGRCMPTVGNLIAWRSLYQSGNQLYVDSVRAPLGFSTYKPGESAPAAAPAEALADDPWTPTPQDRHDVTAFWNFTGGYIVRDPTTHGWIDARYGIRSNSFDPIWQLEPTPDGMMFTSHVRVSGPAIRAMWSDLIGNRGTYTPISEIKP